MWKALREQKGFLLMEYVLSLAAGAVLAALVPLASRIPEERNTEEPTGASLGLDTENLDRLTVEGEETLTFVKQGDSWIYEADPTFPLDEKKITAMLDTLASLSAAKTIDGGAVSTELWPGIPFVPGGGRQHGAADRKRRGHGRRTLLFHRRRKGVYYRR